MMIERGESLGTYIIKQSVFNKVDITIENT